MKKTIFLVVAMMACLSIANTVKAQDAPTLSREIYLYGRFLDFNNLALEYKTELSEGRFFRIGVNHLHIDLSRRNWEPDDQDRSFTSSDIEGRFEIGWERRKQISPRISSFFGVNFFTHAGFERRNHANIASTAINDNLQLSPGLSFSSGVILNISGPFSVAAVLAPEFRYYYYSSATRTTIHAIPGNIERSEDVRHGVALDFNTHWFRIGLIYRWDK